jgi:putative tryptophan/tyrosine transport system substrate-binding protein
MAIDKNKMIPKIYVLILTAVIGAATSCVSLRDLEILQFKNETLKKILILSSADIPSFNTVQSSFTTTTEGKYEIMYFNFRNNYNFIDDVAAVVSAKKPNLIICVGGRALESVAGKIRDIPILFTMVINYQKYNVADYPNIAGISMVVPSESVFFSLKNVAGNVSSVGVLSSTQYQNSFLNGEAEKLRKMGIKLIIETADRPQMAITGYDKISGKIDALWMVPDVSIFNEDNFISLLDRTRKDRKLFIVYSETFVKAGGSFSVSLNYKTMGSQLAVLAQKILDDKMSPSKIGIAPAIGTLITINKSNLIQIGIDLSTCDMSSVDKIME